MIMKNMKRSQGFDGLVSVTLTVTNKADCNKLQTFDSDTLLDVTIKKHREKRTQTQNNYLWRLADEIAKVISSTKLEVYKLAIQQVGVFEEIPIKVAAVPKFLAAWKHNGDGWMCEERRESKIEGYKLIRCYYGSSVYSTQEMARLIDYIVTEAKGLDIDTMSTDEVERLTR